MASTVTMALVYKHHLHIVSIGDCRIYHYHPGDTLHCLTSDHTLAANLVQANLLKPDEVYTSAKNKQLYRFLGQSSQVQVDYFGQEVEANDLVLLCTNGLWHMLRDARLQELLARAGDPQKLARTLVDEANRAGGEGNVSVILIRVQ